MLPNKYTKSTLLFLVYIVLFVITYLKLLLWVAPWRELEIYFVALCYTGGVLALFIAIRMNTLLMARKVLLYLFYSTIIVGCFSLLIGYYLLYTKHNELEYPTLHTAIKTNTIDFIQNTRLVNANRSSLFNLIRKVDTDDELIPNALSYMDSKHQYYKYPTVQLSENYDWTEDPFNDPSWNWNLHNMNYVVTLTRAFEINNNNDYLARAEFLVLDWINDNRLYIFTPPSKYSWNDHSTAFRLLNWLYFYEVWKNSSRFTDKKAEMILRGMLGHAKLLASDFFYTRNHNHGIDQDRALLAFSLMQPNFTQSSKWGLLAQKRIKQQFDFSVSNKGVHLEHSPEYHLYGLEQRYYTLLFLKEWKIKTKLTKNLEISVRKMTAFLPNIIKPNGKIVQVGDSKNIHIARYETLINKLKNLPPLIEQLIAEQEPTVPKKPSTTSYENEGYVILRDYSDDRQTSSLHFIYFLRLLQIKGERTVNQITFLSP